VNYFVKEYIELYKKNSLSLRLQGGQGEAGKEEGSEAKETNRTENGEEGDDEFQNNTDDV